MKVHNFKESILVGNNGEEIVKSYISNLDNVESIEDVSEVKTYQNKDIDLIVKFVNGSTATVEIKTDTYTSGNIFFETVSNFEFNIPGCMYKTEADYLFYYFTKTKELYIISMKDYRAWFESNKGRFTEKKLKNVNRKNNGTYTSIGYTIPKIFLERNFKNYKKVVL